MVAKIMNFSFSNSVNLNGRRVVRSLMHHFAKCHQNWSSGCGDITFFVVLKMAAGGHYGLLNSTNLNGFQCLEAR